MRAPTSSNVPGGTYERADTVCWRIRPKRWVVESLTGAASINNMTRCPRTENVAAPRNSKRKVRAMSWYLVKLRGPPEILRGVRAISQHSWWNNRHKCATSRSTLRWYKRPDRAARTKKAQLSKSSPRDACRGLDRHDSVLDGEMNELGIAVEALRLHHLVLVKFDSSRRNSQRRADFFG